MKKILFLLYYLFINKLPNSRFGGLFNSIRSYYVSRILNVSKGGKNAYFEEKVYIGSPGKVQIGLDCQINENVFIQNANIGDYVMIAPNVSLISNTHITDNVKIPMALQGKLKNLTITVEDDVWLGRNVVVLPGIRIGKGSIVAAGAIVTKDVLPFSVVGGVPAKLLKYRK